MAQAPLGDKMHFLSMLVLVAISGLSHFSLAAETYVSARMTEHYKEGQRPSCRLVYHRLRSSAQAHELMLILLEKAERVGLNRHERARLTEYASHLPQYNHWFRQRPITLSLNWTPSNEMQSRYQHIIQDPQIDMNFPWLDWSDEYGVLPDNVALTSTQPDQYLGFSVDITMSDYCFTKNKATMSIGHRLSKEQIIFHLEWDQK